MAPHPLDDDAPEPEAAPRSTQPKQLRPPFSIGHLLLWTLGCAVLIGGYRYIDRTLGAPAAVNAELWKSVLLLLAMFEAPAVATVVVWGIRRRRRIPFPTEPGEVMLLAGGVSVLAWLLVSWAMNLLGSLGGDRQAADAIEAVIAAVVFGIAWLRTRRFPRWQPLLGILALTSVVRLILLWLWQRELAGDAQVALVEAVLQLALCALILSTAFSEMSEGHQQRGWLHWVGVATPVAKIALMLSLTGWQFSIGAPIRQTSSVGSSRHLTAAPPRAARWPGFRQRHR